MSVETNQGRVKKYLDVLVRSPDNTFHLAANYEDIAKMITAIEIRRILKGKLKDKRILFTVVDSRNPEVKSELELKNVYVWEKDYVRVCKRMGVKYEEKLEEESYN